MIKFPRVFTVLLFIIIVSCESRLKLSDEFIILNIDSLIDNNPIRFTDLFKSYDIIPLESNDDCMFGNIDDIEFCDSVIYVVDQFKTKSVYRFSTEGDFINKIGKIGRGPGEYTEPVDISIDAKKGIVSIYDWTDTEIVDYDQYGNFLKNRLFNERFYQFKIENEKVFSYTPFPWNQENLNEKMIKIFDTNGLAISSHLKFQNYIQGPRDMESTMGGNFFKSENDVKFFSNYIDTIYSLKDSTCKPFMILSSNIYRLTQNDADAFNVRSLKEKVDVKAATKKIMDVSKYSENDSLAYFNFHLGGRTYHMFYDFKSKKAECTSRFEDDLTHILPSLCKISGNKFIAKVFPRDTERFIKIIKSKNIQLSAYAKQRLANMTDLNNPIVIIYELKNKLP